ncbi:MAG TPA: hypothetical protein VF758_08170, partial [Candidatus Acidoferrum sp.]
MKRDPRSKRMRPWVAALLPCCWLLLPLGTPVLAQEGHTELATEEPPKEPPPASHPAGRDTPSVKLIPGKVIRADVDLALVNVTVTDPYSRLVTGLDQDNFRVFEDNVEQELLTFSSEDVPISIGVIFDFSGSMSNKVDKAREAALQFFKTANPQDEFFLV